jgi:hypothetical protein
MTHPAEVRGRPLLPLLIALALVAPACAPHGLAFFKDQRLEIVSPGSHDDVKLPVTIRWRVEDFRVTGRTGAAGTDSGYFGVFVDRAPVPPGKALWIAHDDRHCLASPGCPDKQYLADRDTYDTSDTSFTFPQLPDLDAYHGHELHEVTVVLLDGAGRRIGESAWYVDFYYQREGI